MIDPIAITSLILSFISLLFTICVSVYLLSKDLSTHKVEYVTPQGHEQIQEQISKFLGPQGGLGNGVDEDTTLEKSFDPSKFLDFERGFGHGES